MVAKDTFKVVPLHQALASTPSSTSVSSFTKKEALISKHSNNTNNSSARSMSSSSSIDLVSEDGSSTAVENQSTGGGLVDRISNHLAKFSPVKKRRNSTKRGSSAADDFTAPLEYEAQDSFRSAAAAGAAAEAPCKAAKERDDLEKIRHHIEVQSARERELRQSLRVHTDRAKARFISHNQRGALLSYKKVKRMESEQSNILTSIGYLRNLADDLQNSEDENDNDENDLADAGGQDKKGNDRRGANADTSLILEGDEEEEMERLQGAGEIEAGELLDDLDPQKDLFTGDSIAELLNTSMKSMNLSASSGLALLDVDFEIDRILHTQMDEVYLTDDQLLAELETLTKNSPPLLPSSSVRTLLLRPIPPEDQEAARRQPQELDPDSSSSFAEDEDYCETVEL